MGIHAGPHFSQRAMDGKEAPADGVITGWGDVDGRPVAIAAYDFTVMAGSMGMTGELKVGAPARAGAAAADAADLAARLGRRADPGGRRVAVRRLRAPVPRGGDDVGRRAAGRRRCSGPCAAGHRLHPGPLGLRPDGRRPGRDGARRPAPDQGGDRRGDLDGGPRRRQGPLPQVGRRRPRVQGRRRVHRGGQDLPLVLPLELRAEAAGARDRRSRRPDVGEAARHRPGVEPPPVRHVRA